MAWRSSGLLIYMQLITGQSLSDMVDYSFGDQRGAWDVNCIGGFMKDANAANQEFLQRAKEFEGKTMTLYIDNIRLYPRPLEVDSDADKKLVNWLMNNNNLLALCSLLPNNQFIIFTGQEDTPIDQYIQLPANVLKVYAVNALFNNEQIIPFPMGLQRQIGVKDRRLDTMDYAIKYWKDLEPRKLLYINCAVSRNPERAPLAKFSTNSWSTTRFDKNSKFFPYDRYNEFLSELRNHKFVACPKGHGYDTHRIWETLYMRRVPVMRDDPYFRRLLQGFPVLFIGGWEAMNQELLKLNDWKYEEAQTIDMNKLDLTEIYNKAII